MNRIISILLFTCFIAADAHIPLKLHRDVAATPNKTETKINYRLPNNAEPISYKITLTPYLNENEVRRFTFDGQVEIELNLKEKSSNITLHSKDLNFTIKDVTVINADTLSRLENVDISFDNKTDFAIINNSTFQKGKYKITIKYVGKLNDELRGFYRSSYKNDKDERVYLATTHFEPTGARRAFPCFDEPNYKATFEVIINHEEKYTSFSNMPKNLTESKPGVTVFQKTPEMSTYTLAFVVSDFGKKENKDKNFIVHARPNAVEHTKMALEIGERILDELDNYTGIDFKKKHIPKMEQAAIPNFAAGAMENWGLVLYREDVLLFDEKVSTTSKKQNIVEVIAHEFAHQWFGNLVSPKWWKYVWLNEGFANFFESYITEKVEPSWRTVDQSVVESIQTTLEIDSGNRSHPLDQNVESPEEVIALFDRISYNKGGAVIRMMQHFLTEDTFRHGLQFYLEKFDKKNADSKDLFDALTEVAIKEKGLNVTTIMDGWVNQPGYPVINVTRNYDAKSFEITQEPFFTYNADKNEKNRKWHVPINYATAADSDFNNTTASIWLQDSSEMISANIDATHWLILNKQQTGYYRVNYDEDNWKLIIDYLNSGNHNKVHTLNRAQLMNDALTFVEQDKLNLITLLHLTAHLKNETDYIAWYPGFKTFSWLNEKLINTKHHPFFRKYVLDTMKNLTDSVGFEEKSDDQHLTKLNRVSAINWACVLGDTVCTQKMEEKLTAWLKDNEKNPISPDLMKNTICHGLRNGTFENWNATLTKCLESKDEKEKQFLILTLGCSINRTTLEHYLNYATKDDSPLLNDAFAVIRSVSYNSDIGVDVALNFVLTKYLTLWRIMETEKDVASIYTWIGGRITTPDQLERFKAITTTDVPRAVTAEGIQAAEENVKWVEKFSGTLTAWEKEYNSAGLASASVSLILSLFFITFFNNL